MDQNDKNNKNRRGNRNSNLLGAGKLVAWALALTLVFYCTSRPPTSTSNTATSSP